MKYKFVIGANYGDEGKGLCCDELTKKEIKEGRKVLNVLFNGGPQRAHTVSSYFYGDHIFHHFGSGTLSGADTYFHEEFIVNPMIFVDEFNELMKIGVKTKVFIHSNCRFITPFDMMANQIIELGYSKNDKHGTCGQGIWNTICRYDDTESIKYSFLEFCRMDPDEKYSYLRDIKYYYESKVLKDIPAEYIGPWNSDSLLFHYIMDTNTMYSRLTLVHEEYIESGYHTIIYEAGQGLAIDFDADPIFATPSYTGSKRAIQVLKNKGVKDEDIEVYYVTRTYFTRHGAGPLPTEVSSVKLIDKTNIFNIWQENIRYGNFDSKEMIDRVEKDSIPGIKKNLLITHTNEYPIPHPYMADINEYFNKIYTSDNKYNSTITRGIT